ncbi:mechanosensitive ion channel [Janthinobacterium lividum]|uniref:mechanosensitive ion channel family protein n=1 Tax=Janthinobacterium lividum TaxID=29581 RepID=UPI0015953EF5|nr:mechanosensitive ion channel domain-containing protein [Janthinobacterium lividum]QKY01478.1 mechanosensitive ion channel [Janthinobacterium lividum]
MLGAVLLFSASVQAAPPVVKAPSELTTSPAAVGPIAVQDILARASEEQQQVEFARQLLAGPQPFDRLRHALDKIAGPVDAKQRNASGTVLRGLPIMQLESLARHWEFDSHRFARWDADAHHAFAPYEETAMQLAQRRLAWSATRAAGLLDGLPPAMSERVDTMLAQIDTCETALGVALEREFALSERANALMARIRAGQSDVAAAIDDIDQRLLRVDVPPLWQSLNLNTNSQTSVDAMQRGLQIESQFARDYNAAGNANQQVLRVVQLLLLPLIIWLVVRSPYGTAPAGIAVSALQRPFSAWLLLAMLSVLVFEPDAPLLAQEIVLVLALVPVLRLLPSNTAVWLGVPPYIAVGLYALDRLGVAVVADAGIYRLFLLALNLLALGLTVWMLRRQPPLPAGRGQALQWPRRMLVWLVLVMLSVAAICNVAGNVSLADTLTSGVIDSGYMALMLYAGVAACQGLLRVILSQPQLAGRQLVHRQGPVLQAVFDRFLVLGALIGWLLYSLHRFRLLRPLQGASTTLLGAGIDVGEVSVHVGDVLVFLFASWLAVWIAGAVRRLLREELPSHRTLPRGVGNSIASLSYYGVLILGLLVALSAAGFKVSQLMLVFGALGVGIGFGLQNVVNNFVSGVVLMFERPIQPGDVVDAAGISGTVREIRLRATTIRTFDGADSVVPNGLLLSGNLTNWTMFDRSRRFEVAVGVAYGAEPAQVIAILTATAGATPGVVADPPLVVLMTGYGESALNFVVRAWTNDVSHWMHVRGELLQRVLAALQAAGIAIPYPQIDVNLRNLPGEKNE